MVWYNRTVTTTGPVESPSADTDGFWDVWVWVMLFFPPQDPGLL